MDLLGIFKIALRRWYVLVAALMLTGVLGFVASSQIAPSYQAGGVLVVNIPYAATEESAARLAGNPYYDTRTAASVLSSLAESPDVRTTIGAAGGNQDYIVTLDSGRPVLMVSITDKDEQVALKTYTLLGTELERRLAGLQDDKKIPAEYRVTLDDVLQPKSALASTGSRSKVLLASLALGVVLALGLCVYVDYLIRRRTGEEPLAPAAPPEVPPAPAPAAAAEVPTRSEARAPARPDPLPVPQTSGVDVLARQRTQRMAPVAAPGANVIIRPAKKLESSAWPRDDGAPQKQSGDLHATGGTNGTVTGSGANGSGTNGTNGTNGSAKLGTPG